MAYEILSVNDRAMLVIERPPQEYGRAFQFWDLNGLPVEASNAAQGTLVTEWVQLGETSRPGFMRRLVGKVIDLENADTSRKVRLCSVPVLALAPACIMEHVRRPDGSDLTRPVDWKGERHTSPTLENTLLNEVLVHLVASREQAPMLSNNNIDIEAQTSLLFDGNGNPVLRIDELCP